MSRRRAVAVVALLLAALTACSGKPETRRHAFFALGTLVEISVFNPPAGIDATLRAVEQALLEEEHRWRAWGDGELARINARLAAGDRVELDAALQAGIDRARELAQRSGGRFNPAMGRIVEAWGFHQADRAPAAPPVDGTLAALLPPPALSALKRADDGTWRSTDPRLWIDMGAFAKGLAVETAIGILRARGVRNAIVNAGGDLKVIGRHGERAWRIGVREPRGGGVLAAIDAAGSESVFTSGDYERFFEWQGVRYHHILDPATARPARGTTSVTVIHPDAAVADAAATALFVAGDAWPEAAKSLGIDKAMVVRAGGGIEMTPMMRERVDVEDRARHVEVVGS